MDFAAFWARFDNFGDTRYYIHATYQILKTAMYFYSFYSFCYFYYYVPPLLLVAATTIKQKNVSHVPISIKMPGAAEAALAAAQPRPWHWQNPRRTGTDGDWLTFHSIDLN